MSSVSLGENCFGAQALSSRVFPFVWHGGGARALRFLPFISSPYPLSLYFASNTILSSSKQHSSSFLTFRLFLYVRWVNIEKKGLRLLYTYIHPITTTVYEKTPPLSTHSFFRTFFSSLFSLQHHRCFFFFL